MQNIAKHRLYSFSLIPFHIVWVFRRASLQNMLAAVMAMLVVLCLTKEVFKLITSLDKPWIGFIYGIEVFLCAAVIIHLFCERQRIKWVMFQYESDFSFQKSTMLKFFRTEPLVKTQDMENAHHDSEEIKSIIKQTHALKNHHTFWVSFLMFLNYIVGSQTGHYDLKFAVIISDWIFCMLKSVYCSNIWTLMKVIFSCGKIFVLDCSYYNIIISYYNIIIIKIIDINVFQTALLTTIITSCFWIFTAILFNKADSKKDINAAWMYVFSLLIPTNVYFKDIFIPMIICPLLEFLDPIPAS